MTNQRHREREDRGRRLRARAWALVTVAAGLLYLIWVFRALNPAHPVLGTVFVFAELCCLGLFIVTTIGVWELRFKREEGVPLDQARSVDVFVPVCGEPVDMVTRTLQALDGVRWVGEKRVYVLDDGPTPGVREAADALGFTYLSRDDTGDARAYAKAGNLNFGLAHSQGELILVMDADQVAAPHILEALAGYMRFPAVAFVQSQQSFLVPDGDPFFNNDHVFYEAVQLGLDGGDRVVSCGSGVLYRREALNHVGGFATWNLVEDLTTSYNMHAAGWKSLYYQYPLSVGLSPMNVWGVYRQRGQWALDTLRLFFWDNPLFKRGLDVFGRISYLIIALAYLCAAFVFPFFFVVPIWSYLTGGNVLYRHELEFAAYRGLYFVCMALAMHYLFRGRQAGKQFQVLTGLFPVYARAAVLALLYPSRRQRAYRPNNESGPRRVPPAWLAVLPQLVLLVANAVLPFYAIMVGRVPARLIAANIAISALAIWSLLPVVLGALHAPRAPVAEAPRKVLDGLA
jgi:cellulose synthase (UDP-forming)